MLTSGIFIIHVVYRDQQHIDRVQLNYTVSVGVNSTKHYASKYKK